MDYITKSFRSMLGIFMHTVIAMAVFFLFIKIFPIILLLGFVAFMGYKGFKTIKSWNKNKSGVVTSVREEEAKNNDDSEEFFNGSIIDVEYKES